MTFFPVVRVLRQQEDLQLLRRAFHAGARFAERFARKVFHFGIGEKLFRALGFLPEGLVARIGLHQRGKLCLLAAERRGLLRVRPDFTLREHVFDLRVFLRETFQLFEHPRAPSLP